LCENHQSGSWKGCCGELQRERESVWGGGLATALQVPVVMISKCSIKPLTNPKPVYGHSISTIIHILKTESVLENYDGKLKQSGCSLE
jgi:hypothetical protein